MIQQDKDRLECLRLAASMFSNRAGVDKAEVARLVIEAARQFYAFTTAEPVGRNDRELSVGNRKP